MTARLLVITFAFVGCSILPHRESETVRQGVYAAHDSAKVGRFDLSDSYLDDLTRIVPPPKTRIIIHPIQK